MTHSRYEKVREEALALSEIERSELAHELLESVGEDGTFSPDVADAWHREIEKRIAEVENGEVELIDHEDFIRELRRLPTRHGHPVTSPARAAATPASARTRPPSPRAVAIPPPRS